MTKPIIVDRKFVIFMFLSLAANYVKYSETAINDRNEQTPKPQKQNSTQINNSHHSNYDDSPFDASRCDKTKRCSDLNFPCIRCNYNEKLDCIYGESVTVTCEPARDVQCVPNIENEKEIKKFNRTFMCRYCFLTERWEHDCKANIVCNSATAFTYKTNCTVKNHILCFGSRHFPKSLKCNWTRGSKYFTALILSVTLGGFGVDRFYLGHWQEGIGKLFSFGGLGVWVIVDAILISIGYLGTSDGSLLL